MEMTLQAPRLRCGKRILVTKSYLGAYATCRIRDLKDCTLCSAFHGDGSFGVGSGRPLVSRAEACGPMSDHAMGNLKSSAFPQTSMPPHVPSVRNVVAGGDGAYISLTLPPHCGISMRHQCRAPWEKQRGGMVCRTWELVGRLLSKP